MGVGSHAGVQVKSASAAKKLPKLNRQKLNRASARPLPSPLALSTSGGSCSTQSARRNDPSYKCLQPAQNAVSCRQCQVQGAQLPQLICSKHTHARASTAALQHCCNATNSAAIHRTPNIVSRPSTGANQPQSRYVQNYVEATACHQVAGTSASPADGGQS